MKTSRKFATSPDILVAKGKHSVANATVLVAISSPAVVGIIRALSVHSLPLDYSQVVSIVFYCAPKH